MRLSTPIGQWWVVLTTAILIVPIAQRAQVAWHVNSAAVEEMHAVQAELHQSAILFHDVAGCIVEAHYGPSRPMARETESASGSRQGVPCPPLDLPVLSIRKKHTDYFRYLEGWVMLGQGQEGEALSLWRSVDESDLFTMELGILASKADEVELALAYFELARQINPRIDERKGPMYSAQCRILLWDKRRPADAVHVCSLAARFDEESQILLGRAYVESGKHAEAVGALSRFLLQQPKRSVALYWRARAYREVGNLKAAEQDYQAAIAGDVLVPAAYAELAHVLVSLGEPCRARALLLDAERSANEELRKRARNNLGRLGQIVCDQ